MLRLATSFALTTLIGLGACAAEEGSAPNDEQADTTEVIEFRIPEAATDVDFGSSSSVTEFGQSIAYGHCNPSETDEDGTINIDCPSKWSEVAWFHVSQEQVRALMEDGHGGLDFRLTIEETLIPNDDLRFSVHEVAEDGTKRKILSEPNLGDGETASIALDDVAYEIYLARGENSALIWANGAIEFSIAAEAL